MRLHSGFLAAAAVLLTLATDAAHAAVAPAGRIEVSRRVEPTLDDYIRTPFEQTPLASMTENQQWLSTHARPLVVHDSDPAVSLNVTGWASKPKVAVYYNATGVSPWNPTAMKQASKWLLKRGNKPIMVDGWRALDLTKPAARTWWLYGTDGKATCNPDRGQRAALDLYACGYSSLWLDNALTNPSQGYSPAIKVKSATWARGVLTLLKTLKAKKPKGTTFTINMHWTDTDFGWAPKPKLKSSNPAMRAAKYADQVIIEGGAIDPGLHYALPAKQQWSYGRVLKFADAAHKLKIKLQWEKTSSDDLTANPTPISGSPKPAPAAACGDSGATRWTNGSAQWQGHVRAAAFNYATALATFKTGDSVGDMCEYPGRGWKGYEADLGTPVGKRYTNGKLIIRKFSKGVIAINPSDATVRFAPPKPGVDLASTTWPQPTAAVTAVNLQSRSAAVIQY